MDGNHTLQYFPTTPDSDALHICKENQKMWQINQNPSAVILHEEFSEISSNTRTYCTLNHEKTQRIRYANYLSG